MSKDWMRHAREGTAEFSQRAREQAEWMRREGPPYNAKEEADYYDELEAARLRSIGIPDDADPVDVMVYLQEVLDAYKAKMEAEDDEEEPQADL